jgi:hypothetical protein
LKAESGQQYIPEMAFVLAHLGLDEKEEALDMIEKVVFEHGYWVGTLAVAPELEELHSEPRFKALMKHVNLAE